MKANKTLLLAVTAAALLVAGLFLTLHRSSEQADLGGGAVFSDLKAALGQVTEIRLSKGDGSRTTLRKEATGWTVEERQFPADAQRVRELALGLADLRVVERKTADPANSARLGVEDTDSPTAASTLVEVLAGDKSWKLIIGKSAEGRAVYARKPGEAASFLAAPLITADPDQKRWIDRLMVDLPGARVHEVSARVGKGPAYLLTRAEPGADLALSPVPKGRSAVSGMALGGQAEALASFHFDDVRAATEGSAGSDTVTYRTFDGRVITFTGRREADKAFVTVTATRDPELAAKFAPPAPTPATPETTVAPPPPAGEAIAAAPQPATDQAPPAADESVERLGARAQGVEFEIPVYKYEAIFRPYEQMLEPKTGAAR